ncbi:MAG: UDP-N-acetylmuramoyl-tripeptide--D-alanyl-D-alanine ligase [Bacteroidia bacterium]|nr:UDP-N-acetylmuramoyl-tripeptide--D-alanyl-D-alanine ligase [Bacteroidia bacterium]
MSQLRIKTLYQIFLSSKGVSTDTRSIAEGQIFFALKGPSFNGNQYASHALELGAMLVVIDEPEFYDDSSGKYFLVDNCLSALQDLATFHRQQSKAKILAITGSNGKTTTKELIGAVLKTSYNVNYTKGNLNNHIGVPLTLLELTNETQFGIIEMGANHIGEIKDLCEIAQPDFGLITNVGSAHLEGFGSLEGVKQGKGELYDYLRNTEGLIFINSDVPSLSEMLTNYQNVYAYSQGNNFAKGTRIEIHEQSSGLKVVVDPEGENQAILVQLFGMYNATNILAAINVGHYFGVQLDNLLLALSNYVPANKRSQVMNTKSNTVIMDAYNANPTSMGKAIEAFCKLKDKSKIVILGDMFELGPDSIMLHKQIVDYLQANFVGDCVLVGENFCEVAPKEFDVFQTTDDCLDHFAKSPIYDSTILVKGSRGMKLERVLDFL